MNIASFSLYGYDKKFMVGAVENAKAIKNLPGDWTGYFYCGAEITEGVKVALQDLGSKVIEADSGWHPNGMFWRFYPFGNEKFARVIVRDVDSRISEREVAAIQEWVSSGKLAHIMRDHPYHATEILGGMWGARSELSTLMQPVNSELSYSHNKGQDQFFLRDKIYPLVAEDALIHDSFFNHESEARPFPKGRISNEYVGEVIEADGSFNQSQRNKVAFYEKHRLIWNLRRSLISF